MEKTKKYLLCILTFSLLIRLILLSIPTEIWWDEAVYISIGKYLFSNSASGFMEYLRPLLLPFLLGIIWKASLDPITSGRILAIICSLATIYMTYLITKKIHNEKAAILAALILSITGYFIYFSTKILTGIPSILLILIAINELINKPLTKKNIIIAGIATALAFLTRFTSILLIIPILYTIIISKKKYKDKINNITTFLLSFGITLAPYLIYMHLKYSNPLFSISSAIAGINESKIYYTSSILDIALQIILQNPLLIFSIFGIWLYIKNTDSKKSIILAELAMAAITIYVIPVKIIRYSLIALPFLSITAGSGLHELSKKSQITKKLKHLNKSAVSIAALVLIILIAITVIIPYIQTSTQNQQAKENIYIYPKTNSIKGPIITTTPLIAAYTDNRIISLAWPNYARKVYETKKTGAELIFINTCDLICRDTDTACRSSKEEFIGMIEQENKKIKEETINNCTYLLFKSSFYEKKPEKPPEINTLWWDEAIYMGLAENLYHNKTYTFNFGDQEKFRPPLYPLTLAALFLITGPNESAPVCLNILITLMTAIATYLLAKELFCDKKISTASAILAVTSQQYIFWTSKILTEPLAILLTTASLLIFIRITKSKKTNLYPLLGLILALAFLTRYPLGLLPIYFGLMLLATDKNHLKQNRKKITLASIIFLITLTPWMYQSCITYSHPLGAAIFNIHQVNDLYEPEPKTFYISGFYTSLPYLGPLFTIGILLSALGKSAKKKEQQYLIGWFIITLLLLSFGIGQKFERYLLIALPPIAIISAKTLNTLAEKITKKHASIILAIIILAISISSAQAGFTKATQDKENGIVLRQAADHIKTHSGPGNSIMSENYALFHYYTKQHVIWYPKDTWAIDEFIKRYNISYIVVENSVSYPQYSKDYFDSNPGFTKEFEKKQGQDEVKLYKCTKE